MDNHKTALKEKYDSIMNSENPFIEGFYGLLQLTNYLGNEEYSCLVIKEGFGEPEVINMTLSDLQKYELDIATF